MDLIIKLISVWLILQLFNYQYLTSNTLMKLMFTITPARVGFISIVVLFFLKVARGKIKLVPLNKIDKCMIFFTIICTISYFISSPDAGLERHRNLTTLLNITFLPFITYFVVKNLTYSRERINIVVWTLCLIGCYLTLTGVFEHYNIERLVWPKYILDPKVGLQFGRARGPFVESTAMGRNLTITILCGIMLLSYSVGLRKMLLFLFVVFCAVAIYFTYTRGPWLGFGISLLILIFSRTRMRKPAIYLVLLVFMGGVIGVGAKLSLFETTLFSKRQKTVQGRMVVFTTALRMGMANPIFGVGFGKFDSEWDNYFKEIEGISFAGFDGNHNTFLGIFAEAGVGAFILFILIFYLMVKTCLRLYNRIKDTDTMPYEKCLIILVIAMISSYLVTAQTIDSRFNPLMNNIVFLFFGFISSLDRETSKCLMDK